jgi:eukaryotic-like serine/threonine-protein kinase
LSGPGGRTLLDGIAEARSRGGYSTDEFRRVASDLFEALALRHGRGEVHGDLKPALVLLGDERAMIAGAEGPPESRSPWGASPDSVGAPNYAPPERLRGGGVTASGDVYALALTLWQMWTWRVPEPGFRPRAQPLWSQVAGDGPSGLSTDELRQIYRCLNEEPTQRPLAREVRFYNPAQLSGRAIALRHEWIEPGPPPPSRAAAFRPGAQALLVTYANNAPELVGRLLPLTDRTLTLGRRDDAHLVLPEGTVSGHHASLRWQGGAWLIDDAGSANGTFVDHRHERVAQMVLTHGSEVQFGECRVKLVHFEAGSFSHKLAIQYLSRRDGLTGLLPRGAFIARLDDECGFADWAELTQHVARFSLRSRDARAVERATTGEMLAMRRAARLAVDIAELSLPSLTPALVGRTQPLELCISMMGATHDEARYLSEQVSANIRAILPPTLDVDATVVKGKQGGRADALLGSQARLLGCSDHVVGALGVGV